MTNYKEWIYVIYRDYYSEDILYITRDLDFALTKVAESKYRGFQIWYDNSNYSSIFFCEYISECDCKAYELMKDLLNTSLDREFIRECRKTLDPYIEKYLTEQKVQEELKEQKKREKELKLLAELKAKYEK